MTPKKKSTPLHAQVAQFPDKKIYLNVGHLDKGQYELNIVYKNKLIVKTTFKKP
ncbi:hypothetical protein [Flavobacterium caeni]|uniref:hypothetical protein n=1 Tax=Flavobacterium caeni TaxID=490189 RepID=UPI0014798A70|nr:hypothetical protein [Flavobacterium caeni]